MIAIRVEETGVGKKVMLQRKRGGIWETDLSLGQGGG
jgi:hypothetical protein